MQTLFLILQVAIVAALIAAGFYVTKKRLDSYFSSRPHLKFRYQLIQIGGILLAILFVILFMPFDQTLRGQLLSLYGLIISATIALSSTTLVGNIMAGFMLKAIGSCRPGNYITVGDYFGRISEMDLLHTEIQTEERDLTTLPNLYLVTHPVRVMRQSGTLLSVDVSLGYDVSRHRVEKLLVQAALDTGLESPYVQIRQLGDFSVSYQVSGLLREVNNLIDKRRDLRARTMDALHQAGVEIVSPNFMNTRAFDQDQAFIPDDMIEPEEVVVAASPDSLVFDKAEKAESVSNLREKLAELESQIRNLDAVLVKPPNEQAQVAATTEKAQLKQRAERLSALIARKEAKISSD
jgi:small-conductance mechanosensitive channel